MIAIREATSADVDIVYELISAIAKHHGQEQHVITDRSELLISGFGESPKFDVLLAEAEGEVAGFLSYTWNYSIWLGSRYMNIDDVFVRQEFRGQKIGEALMYKAQRVCRTHGISRIRWEVQQSNHSAIKFYERLGATLDTKGVFRWDEVSTTANTNN
ncbi:MAG: GNAT family N-acetyltransferase [Pseudomonadales bacterium]